MSFLFSNGKIQNFLWIFLCSYLDHLIFLNPSYNAVCWLVCLCFYQGFGSVLYFTLRSRIFWIWIHLKMQYSSKFQSGKIINNASEIRISEIGGDMLNLWNRTRKYFFCDLADLNLWFT